MSGLTLVKKTQKEWRCGLCLQTINQGSMMIRESMNRWEQYQFCLECGKPKIEDALEQAKKTFEMFRDDNRDNKPMSAHSVFKKDLEYFEELLKAIKAKEV